MSSNELNEYLNSPLFYINNFITKNKFKNDSYFSTKELLGILNKDSYFSEYKKINCSIIYNNKKINMESKEDIITTLYNETIKNNYNMNFSESIDFDIEIPDIKQEIICKKCKSKNIIPIEEHKRSFDEASEYYLKCEDCNKKFYF